MGSATWNARHNRLGTFVFLNLHLSQAWAVLRLSGLHLDFEEMTAVIIGRHDGFTVLEPPVSISDDIRCASQTASSKGSEGQLWLSKDRICTQMTA